MKFDLCQKNRAKESLLSENRAVVGCRVPLHTLLPTWHCIYVNSVVLFVYHSVTVLSKVNQTRYSIIVTYITVTEFNEMDSKLKSYDGTGDVKVFLEKVSLHSSLKGYNGEKAAQNLASRLEGRAFDVYMRLPAADKKSVEKIHAELLKEFEHGNQNREAAIFELNNRKRDKDESPQTFAFKLLELVKLAYPSFEDEARKTIAKDYFIRGVHPNMQIALKSIPDFATASIDKLAAETSRLQIASVARLKFVKIPNRGPKKSQNAVVFLKKSRDFSELHYDVISFLCYIERVIIVYG